MILRGYRNSRESRNQRETTPGISLIILNKFDLCDLSGSWKYYYNSAQLKDYIQYTIISKRIINVQIYKEKGFEQSKFTSSRIAKMLRMKLTYTLVYKRVQCIQVKY